MAAAGPTTAAAAALARKIAETAARIFGNVLGTPERSGRKLLNKPLIGERVASYYPERIEATDPLFEDPLERRCGGSARRARVARVRAAWRLLTTPCRRKVKLERMKRRGKSPPKKGQGKRASKGK
jgi:small subunit ribosomal protein S33